ncbi:MAG TPA: hypothetical protein PKH69_00820 [Thiobacillaceae bacterium]|nr:hypothetical protein [Thiobacillaceae bacterium]HNU63343.1 hypothetical protein [Thiobacillaceae bacterium]
MSTQTSLPQIAAGILAYLQRHPNAADTARGIARWWLPAPLGQDVELVAHALDTLLQQGLLHRQVNADRQTIYSGRDARGQG